MSENTKPNKTLRLILKESYGVTRWYPDCDASKVLVSMLKQTTFTETDMKRVVQLGIELGFEIEVKGSRS
jgi:hypothetical protein